MGKLFEEKGRKDGHSFQVFLIKAKGDETKMALLRLKFIVELSCIWQIYKISY